MNIRPLTEDDRARLARLIAADVEHSAQRVHADFFLQPRARGEASIPLCFEDEQGPVFYVRLDVEGDTVRVHMQFDETLPRRTVRLLNEGFAVVQERCRAAGARRLVFDSINAGLRIFCQRRFGFQPISGTADLELSLGKGAE